MIKDIVLPITGAAADAYALNMALDLARAYDAHVRVLEMVNLPLPVKGPWGLMPDASMADVYRQLREQGEANVAVLKNRLKDEAVSTEVRLVQSFFSEPSKLAAHCAHLADLSVVAITPTDSVEGDISRTYFGSMLIDSGRPVLVIPPRCKVPMPPRKIVVAWRQTRECARAIHDAMPLLKRAESVEVLIIDPVSGEGGEGENPGSELLAHLDRHGVKVSLQVRQSHDNRIAAVLDDFVKETHANMLVAGGYGHSRLREWALGGVTRELLFETTVPVFFSH